LNRRITIALITLLISSLIFWGLLYILSHYLNYQPWYRLQHSAIIAKTSAHSSSVEQAWRVRKQLLVFFPIEAHMKRYGLINIQDSIPEIFVDLRYSTADNFTEHDLYGDCTKAMAHPYVVHRLKRAHALLKIRRPDLEFIIFDAARPKRIQDSLWVYLKDHLRLGIVTKARGGQSYHNYGLALDIVLLKDTNNDGSFETASWETNVDFDKDGKADWMKVIQIFKSNGWEWGGDWKFKDTPHVQTTFGLTTRQLLAKHNAKDFIQGTTYVNI